MKPIYVNAEESKERERERVTEKKSIENRLKVMKLNYFRESVNKVNRVRSREFVATTKVIVRVVSDGGQPRDPCFRLPRCK